MNEYFHDFHGLIPERTHRVTEGEKDGALGNQEDAAELALHNLQEVWKWNVGDGTAVLTPASLTSLLEDYREEIRRLRDLPRTAAVNEHQTPTPNPLAGQRGGK